MSENTEVYEGVTVVTGSREGSVLPKLLKKASRGGARLINDTEFSFTGSWEHQRLLPRKMQLFNNTRSMGAKGAQAVYNIERCTAVYCLFAQEQPSAAEIYIDGKLAAHTKLGSKDNPDYDKSSLVDTMRPESDKNASVCKFENLPDGKHTVKIVALEDGLGLDALFIKGKKPSFYSISPDNSAFMHSFMLKDGVLPAGESAEFWFSGKFVRVFGSGKLVCLLDGKRSRRALPAVFSGLAADQWHCLRMIAAEDVKFCHFEISDGTPFMTYANAQTDAELERMARFESKAASPDTWQPVAVKATMPQKGVKLKGGVFAGMFDKNIKYLKESLDLPCFVTAKDQDRIWVDMLPASNDGRMLGGMGNTLRYREVPGFRKAMASIIEPYERRQFTNYNGYCLPYESTNFELCKYGWPHFMRDEEKNYDRTMFTKGALAAGSAGDPDGYKVARGLTDWFNSCKYRPLVLLGGMGIQGSAAGPRVYFSPVGKPQDIITNQDYYDMDWWLDSLARRIPEAVWRFTLNRPHNYLLTSVCALLDIYRATGDERYLNATLGALDIYNNYFKLPGGAITICEHFECQPETHFIANTPNNIFETCATVFMMELMGRLMDLYPANEKYAAQLEECAFNILASCQGPDGTVRYFNHMNGVKMLAGRYNTCCEIQATMLIGELPKYIYQTDEKGVYVNLFASSALDFTVDGADYTLDMSTRFPYANTVKITVGAQQKGSFALRLRMPAWLHGSARLKVNGKAVDYKAGQYAVIERTWQNGDTVTLSLPMAFHAEQYHGMHDIPGRKRSAVMLGPVLMAVCGPLDENCCQCPGEPVVNLDLTAQQLIKNLVPLGNRKYAIEGAEGYILKPYCDVADGETFSCFPALNAD